MQIQIFSEHNSGGGGRIASPKLRALNEQCENFTGLEEGVNRYDLLLLVKRIGKTAGFSPRMISLLDYYMAFTRDIDWEEGSRPIVYKSLSSTALDMGVSERQIQALEKQLFELGAISWCDSGNHRRYGQRCPDTGQILYAFGVDLSPLAYLRAELQNKLHEKQLYDEAWRERKRQISFYRRQIRSILLEAERRVGEQGLNLLLDESDLIDFCAQYEAISYQIRTSHDLDHLGALLGKHKALLNALENKIERYDDASINGSDESKFTQKDSCTNEENFTHYKYTKQKPSNKLDYRRDKPISFQKSVADPSQDNLDFNETDKEGSVTIEASQHLDNDQNTIVSTGLQHLTLKQLLNASTPRFREYLPVEPRPMNHNDFIEAAYKLKSELGISQSSWGHACLSLGRIGAAVCVILTEQGMQRDENRVTRPAAYFNAMINRAKIGELHLQQSVMGILRREFGDGNLIKEKNSK